MWRLGAEAEAGYHSALGSSGTRDMALTYLGM